MRCLCRHRVLLASLFFVSACGGGLGAAHSQSSQPGASFQIERAPAEQAEASELISFLKHELAVNLERLQHDELETPAYFLAYDVVASDELLLEARDGVLTRNHQDRGRLLDVDVRVGSPALDNSHSRDGNYGGNGLGLGMEVALDDIELSLAQALWVGTELQYKDAMEALSQVESSELLLTRSEDIVHPDFSEEKSMVDIQPLVELDFEAITKQWKVRIEQASRLLADHADVYSSAVMMSVRVETRIFVNSEGSEVQGSRVRTRLILQANSQAEDGMAIERFQAFDVHNVEELPHEEELQAAALRLRKELLALRDAPLAEPYTGPAVLEGPAAGVFFHEIFGHRLEGHRQKDDLEGQTFTHMLGQSILPKFLDVVDDPTVSRLNGVPMNGHYFIDDEAVKAQRVVLVESGKLKGFLLGRSPVLPFAQSNGHGRREVGNQVVARQGNLIVSARKTMPEKKLRDALIREAKRQGKPYGLWFKDIQGGYTITDRSGPQAFKVLPLMVYRVWTDGREDELVRGADIVGTPLAAFETISAAGDQPGVFNGLCGAESGWVPVSAVSPSLLLKKLEIERAVHGRNRPPLLVAPADREQHLKGAL